MQFALFYEIPVARPWNEHSELEAYQNTLEQAILGDKADHAIGRAFPPTCVGHHRPERRPLFA